MALLVSSYHSEFSLVLDVLVYICKFFLSFMDLACSPLVSVFLVFPLVLYLIFLWVSRMVEQGGGGEVGGLGG